MPGLSRAGAENQQAALALAPAKGREVTILRWSDAMRYLGPEPGLPWPPGTEAPRLVETVLHRSLNITSSPLYLTFSQDHLLR